MNKNSGKISINSNGFLFKYVKMLVILSILKVEYRWSENLKSEMLQNLKFLMPTGEKGILVLMWPSQFKVHWKYHVSHPRQWDIESICEILMNFLFRILVPLPKYCIYMKILKNLPETNLKHFYCQVLNKEHSPYKSYPFSKSVG